MYDDAGPTFQHSLTRHFCWRSYNPLFGNASNQQQLFTFCRVFSRKERLVPTGGERRPLVDDPRFALIGFPHERVHQAFTFTPLLLCCALLCSSLLCCGSLCAGILPESEAQSQNWRGIFQDCPFTKLTPLRKNQSVIVRLSLLEPNPQTSK